jgi:uncharacterized protein with HEPN domain
MNEVQANEHKCHKVSFKNRLLRTEAIQESINIIGTASLRFSAAVREQNPVVQEQLVLQLRETLAEEFFVELNIGMVTLSANDFNSLLAVIQALSAQLSFESTLVGNFSVVDYKRDCHCRRSVNLQSLEYIIQTQVVGGQSLLMPALDQWEIVETDCNEFKVKKLVATTIGFIFL